jgi:ketosteroid isomerase-like protein
LTSSNAARRFVDKINAHDVEGLVALMTANHAFVDSLGDKSTRPAIEKGWRRYFDMVPDYWVRVDRVLSDKNTSVLIGLAGGTYVSEGGVVRPENKWETPAVWVARIEGQKVAEWRIYSDNEPIRSKMTKSNG